MIDSMTVGHSVSIFQLKNKEHFQWLAWLLLERLLNMQVQETLELSPKESRHYSLEGEMHTLLPHTTLKTLDEFDNSIRIKTYVFA
jgi:hypothetical protein